MTHDQERRYHEQQHAAYVARERQFASYTDLDVLREMAMEREEKEKREVTEKEPKP